MNDRELYQSALGKVHASDAWKQRTLAALRAAQGQAPQGGGRAVPFRRRAARCAVLAACLGVACLAAWPQARRALGAGGTAGAPQTALMDANGAAPYTAPDAAQAPENAPAADAAPRANSTDGTDGADGGLQSKTRAAGEAVPFSMGFSGGAGELIVRGWDDLATANPTRDLPEGELPAELYVWPAQNGAGLESALRANLQLALALTGEQAQPTAGQAGPGADTVYLQAAGKLWRYTAQLNELQLASRADKEVDEAQFHSAEAARQADSAALAWLAGGVLQLSAPQWEATVDYTVDGLPNYTNHTFYYEAGEEGDSLSTRLYNYLFRRVSGSLYTDGSLRLARATLPPQGEPTLYPLRSLSQALEAVRAGEAWLAGAQGGYDPQAEVLHYEIVYQQDGMLALPLQPVYRFTIAGGEPPAGLDGCQTACYLYVPAVAEEYSVPYEHPFN